jgi:cytochrome c556
MSNRMLAAAVACTLAAVALSQAPAGAHEGAPDAATFIRARQSALMLSAATLGSMKGVIESGGDVNSQAFGAKALARWARTLPSLFPAGSGAEAGLPTRAKPEVWSDRAGFEARAAEYAAAADRLAELAQANDKAGFAAQWAVVGQTCSSCHDRYRENPPARAQ